MGGSAQFQHANLLTRDGAEQKKKKRKKNEEIKNSNTQTEITKIRPNMLHKLTLQTPNFGSSWQIVREPGDLPRSADAKLRVPSSRGSMMKLMWKGLKMHLSHGCYILARNKTGLKWMGKSPASLFKTQSQVFFVLFFFFLLVFAEALLWLPNGTSPSLCLFRGYCRIRSVCGVAGLTSNAIMLSCDGCQRSSLPLTSVVHISDLWSLPW